MNHSEYGLVYNILYSDSDLNVTSTSRWLFRIKAPFIARVDTKELTSMLTVRDYPAYPYTLSDFSSLVGKTTVRGVKRVELSEILLITLVTITFLVNAVLFKFKKPNLTVRLNLKDFFRNEFFFNFPCRIHDKLRQLTRV